MAVPGTLESIVDRRIEQWEAIAGISKAFKDSPAAIPDGQLPAVIIETTGPVTKLRYGYDTLIVTRRLVETVYIRPTGAHVSDKPIGSAWALVDAIDAAMFPDARLEDADGAPLDSVKDASMPSDNGFEILPYADKEYVALRFVSDVQYLRVFALGG